MLTKHLLFLSFWIGLFGILYGVDSSANIPLGQNVNLAAFKNKGPTSASYQVQVVDLGSTKLREYVSRSGVVFGISWKGYFHPELAPLLGTYWDDFRAASQGVLRKQGQRAAVVRGSRVVVERWGHMRNLQGRAYIPSLLPEGITPDALR